MRLRRYLLASTLCVLPFAVNAADMPTKARPAPVIQPIPYSWTGFYVGVSGGIIGQNSKGTDIGDGSGGGLIFTAGDQYGIPGVGGIVGGNIGYNWQFAPNWVLGVEADISWTSVDDTFAFNCSPCSAVASKLDYLGTVRARFGYVFDSFDRRAMLYATGGFAYGRVKNYATFDPTTLFTVNTSGTQTGWTAGAGLEYAFTNNWTARAEFLYVDLGDADGIDSSTSGCRFGFDNRYIVGRLGINYKF
jgi:outer membrane immunogenic protein